MHSYAYNFVFQDIPDEIHKRCAQYPWFSALLNDATLKPMQTSGRRSDHTASSTLMSRTLNSEDTISACQSFFKIPSHTLTAGDELNLGEMQIFYCLGNGLDGHDGVCHGGFLSAALDHAMGSLARAYPAGTSIYTKYLHIDFIKPLPVPGPVLSRTWMTKVQDRKLWICGRMEDEQGHPYVTAEGLFVKPGLKL